MKKYPKKFSTGAVSVYCKKRGSEKGGRADDLPRWRGSIKVGTVTEVVDERGRTVLNEDGTPKLKTTWKTVSKVFPEVECVRMRGGRYRGVREAEAAFDRWRDDLIAADQRRMAAYERSARSAELLVMPIPDFLDAYIDGKVSRGEIELSTEDGYRCIAKHAKRYFADVLVGELTPQMIEDWKAHMVGEGKSASTRNKAFRVIKQAYQYEVFLGNMKTSPFDRVKTITPSKADPNPLDAKSLDRLRSALEDAEPTAFTTAVALALRTGMREGEICGLRWRDVSMDTGAIFVCNAIGRIQGGTRSYEKAPKGRNGQITNRHIPGSPKLKQLLAERKKYFLAELAVVGGRFSEDMYVVGDVDGNYYNPTMLGRRWAGYAQDLRGTKGRRPTFHDLRHTYATQALHARIDPVVVASILGHKDPKLTMTVYADAMPESKQAAALIMDDVI